MTSPAGTPGRQDDPSTTIGVGGVTSGQQGATPSHETQQETGGSGGDGLTRNQSGETANAPASEALEAGNEDGGMAGEAGDSAMTHVNRGAQDTRSSQAGRTATGMGSPETGGNQTEGDLPPVSP
ncbi:hypothetical protein [Massilia sp. ST3]|uniref:hypothetical protein n=1 Tax=Massilia sp. ST3 TaxID=2824903 RepID=UPI001B835FE4|nr:hypothetical protein [Massilia sp. ST3]MBQ5945977.1 hypothetical protein [Massilia sp. ST3]